MNKTAGYPNFFANFALMLGIGFMLSGCSGFTPTYRTQLVAEPDPLALRLADAVDRATVALETLAEVEQNRKPPADGFSLEGAPRELLRTVTIDWVGPIEPIAERLANRAGYDFNALGDLPPVPIIVTVHAVHRPVLEVLRDIGLQAGLRADLIVDAKRQAVEVTYAPATGG